MRALSLFASAFALLAGSLVSAVVQRPGAFGEGRDHPAIRYTSGSVTDPVHRLNEALASGTVTLNFDDAAGGYLRSVLGALDIPVASQVLAFAEISLQARIINRGNPRAIYFNDTVAVGWVRGGDVLEVAAHDPQQGVIFYTLPTSAQATPRFTRDDSCLACHLSWDTLAVPGLVLQTVFPRKSERDYAAGGSVDHRLTIAERWGGWFVTGRQVPPRHMGNQPTMQPKPVAGPTQKLASVKGEIDTTQYLTDTSDVAALLVLDHQAHAANLLTRLNWEARIGNGRVDEAARELVDYLLFVDEAPIPGTVQGTSGFAEAFKAGARTDAQGRSLRSLQLEGRLMQYPLSFMIDTPMFDALPPAARAAVATRMAAILAGRDTGPKYAHLTPAIRTTLVDMLEALKPGLLP